MNIEPVPILKVKSKKTKFNLPFTPRKNIKNRSFLFGDFDDDGIANADDMYPFNPEKSEQVSEILLTEELRKIRKHNRKYIPTTRSVARNVDASRTRIKTVNSTINKLRRKKLDEFTDIGATMIVVDSEKDIKDAVRKVKKRYPNVVKEKNYYKNPKEGYYVAYHLVVLAGKNKLPIEIQIKTRRQARFHDKVTHEGYKRDTFSVEQKQRLIKRMKRLRELDKK